MSNNFAPSAVQPNFVGSTLKKTELEVLAAQIVTYLAQNGDDWNAVVEIRPWLEHAQKEHKGMCPLCSYVGWENTLAFRRILQYNTKLWNTNTAVIAYTI